jgi:hypothetical protein
LVIGYIVNAVSIESTNASFDPSAMKAVQLASGSVYSTITVGRIWGLHKGTRHISAPTRVFKRVKKRLRWPAANPAKSMPTLTQ